MKLPIGLIAGSIILGIIVMDLDFDINCDLNTTIVYYNRQLTKQLEQALVIPVLIILTFLYSVLRIVSTRHWIDIVSLCMYQQLDCALN
jgi:1,4-dihydroxy-2-naphthoate octaprenyltransferase